MLLLGLEKNLTFGIFIIENITCCLLKKITTFCAWPQVLDFGFWKLRSKPFLLLASLALPKSPHTCMPGNQLLVEKLKGFEKENIL